MDSNSGRLACTRWEISHRSGLVPVAWPCLVIVAPLLHITNDVANLAGYLWLVTGVGLVLGLGNALTLIATQSVAPPRWAGAASGVTKTAVTLSGGLAVALAGAAERSVADISLGCLVVGAAVLAGSYWVRRPPP